jgi:hypothetical protein
MVFHDLYYSPNDAITENEMLGPRLCMGEMRNVHIILVKTLADVGLNGRLI